jgi:hypothetical protein
MFRPKFLFLCVFLIVAVSCKKGSSVTRNTLTLQPTDNPNEMDLETLNGQDHTQLTSESIDVDAWTGNGDPWTLRGLFKFDLSTIPSTATIDSAALYLYSDSTPITANLIDANFGTANSFAIQQVTSDWSPSTVTWSNQPSVSTTNSIIIPTTSQSFLDLRTDVTSMITSMVKNNTNYGFLLQLQTEVTYNSRIFVSSHNTKYPDRHPKLVVGYHY